MSADKYDKAQVLFVTRALLAPPHAGCMIRALNICRQLAQTYRVTMLGVADVFDPHSLQLCQNEFERFEKIQLKPYTDYPPLWGRFLLKWHMHWPFTPGVQASPSDQARFNTLRQQHDLVWFHTIRAAAPFKINRFHALVMDLDDLNQCKYAQHAEMQPTLRLRLSARVQAYKWKRAEQKACERFDRVVVCSEDDKDYINGDDKTIVIPNGYCRPQTEPNWTETNPMRLGFIGLLAYGPNRDGLAWFRDRVWPIIRANKPQMKLRIIGKLPSEKDHIHADGFEYTGFIEDAAAEIASWSAMVVPIPYGGGTRIKILDAFSKKCPVIATHIGAHGIAAVNGRHLLMTDDPQQFARHCLDMSDTPEQGRDLAEAAWELFCNKYAWDVIGVWIRDIVAKTVNQDQLHGQ